MQILLLFDKGSIIKGEAQTIKEMFSIFLQIFRRDIYQLTSSTLVCNSKLFMLNKFHILNGSK